MKQHVGTCSCGTTVIIQSDDAKEITIPRDHYDLLKEAAEEWARGQIIVLPDTLCWMCKACGRSHIDTKPGGIIHASTCHAAIILDLEREGEG